MNSYVEKNDVAFNAQLQNFNSKLPSYDTTFGLTSGVNSDVSISADDGAYFNYVVQNCTQQETRYHDWVAYKTLARKTNNDDVLGTAPAALPAIINPGAVPAGIEDRFRTLCQRIKKHGAYTVGIGQDLGIEAPTSVVDLDSKKPVLTIKTVAGHPHIDWKKDNLDALDLYGTDDTSGAYVLLGTLTGHSFVDNRTLPTGVSSRLRKYKGIYRKKDVQIGQMSDEVSVTVATV